MKQEKSIKTRRMREENERVRNCKEKIAEKQTEKMKPKR